MTFLARDGSVAATSIMPAGRKGIIPSVYMLFCENWLAAYLEEGQRMKKGTIDRLQKAFETVRRDYFPRWDKGKKWHLEYDNGRSAHGICDTATKTIWIGAAVVPEREKELLLTIIHEICHSFHGCGGLHGPSWQQKMRQKAHLAKQKGDEALAGLIQEDIEGYTSCPERIYASTVYNSIEQIVSDIPGIAYPDAIGRVAEKIGLYPHELETKYKRCKQVYQKATKYKK